MFSTVRGKERGSITKSKKDIGVSATDKREAVLQENSCYAAVSQYSSVSPGKGWAPCCGDPSEGHLAHLLKPGMTPGPDIELPTKRLSFRNSSHAQSGQIPTEISPHVHSQAGSCTSKVYKGVKCY